MVHVCSVLSFMSVFYFVGQWNNDGLAIFASIPLWDERYIGGLPNLWDVINKFLFLVGYPISEMQVNVWVSQVPISELILLYWNLD